MECAAILQPAEHSRRCFRDFIEIVTVGSSLLSPTRVNLAALRRVSRVDQVAGKKVGP